jgi:beta-glucosidase
MSNRTYRYFAGRPLFAFGHGLSYTAFDYKTLTLSSASAKADESITASVIMSNTGKRDGDEVVQLYATAVKPPVPMPLRQLIGFKRVSLKAGETKTVEIVVPVNQLRRWDEAGKHYLVDPGAYNITVSPASDKPALKATLTVHAQNTHNR